MLRPQKQEGTGASRSKVNSLKENDRVVTIGGIHGVVTNVQRDAERVTIRVDESTGTKLRVNMSAIARVLTDEDEEGAATGNQIITKARPAADIAAERDEWKMKYSDTKCVRRGWIWTAVVASRGDC